MGSPALQADSFPTELSGKPKSSKPTLFALRGETDSLDPLGCWGASLCPWAWVAFSFTLCSATWKRGLLWASSTGLFSCGLLILANFRDYQETESGRRMKSEYFFPLFSSFCFYYLVLSPSCLNCYLSLNSVFHPYYSPYFSSLSPPPFPPPLFPHNHTIIIFFRCSTFLPASNYLFSSH